MAEFIYQIPDEQLAEMGAAFCQQYGYNPDDGLTPLEFTLARIDLFIKEMIKAHRIWKADKSIETEKQAAIDEVDTFKIEVKRKENKQ